MEKKNREILQSSWLKYWTILLLYIDVPGFFFRLTLIREKEKKKQCFYWLNEKVIIYSFEVCLE